MNYGPTETIEIRCEVIRQTDKAWLISDGKREVWIAKSQISDKTESANLFGARVNSIFVPVWLAEEKNLI